MATITAIVSAKESAKIVLTDFLSVPKIIGTGPIIITPAAFTFPLPAPRIDAKIIAATIIIMPTTINPNPRA